MKDLKYLILILMALVAFNSCTDDEVTEPQQGG